MSQAHEADVDAKQAIEIAKQSVRDMFVNDHVQNIGLEELDFDGGSQCWHIRVGFSRPWAQSKMARQFNPHFPENSPRTYKVVVVSLDGLPRKILNRDHWWRSCLIPECSSPSCWVQLTRPYC